VKSTAQIMIARAISSLEFENRKMVEEKRKILQRVDTQGLQAEGLVKENNRLRTRARKGGFLKNDL